MPDARQRDALIGVARRDSRAPRGAGCVSGQPTTPTVNPFGAERCSTASRVRNVADVCGRSIEEPEPLEPVRETVVGQQLQIVAAAGQLVDGRRSHAVLLRQLAGGHRRPHRFGRRRLQRREMPHRAGVEDAAEVRQPPFGGRARDEIERGGVDRDHRDPRGRLGPGVANADVDRPRLEQRRRAAAAHRDRRDRPTPPRRSRRAAPTAHARSGVAAAQQREQHAENVAAAASSSAALTERVRRGRRVEHRARTRIRLRHISTAPARCGQRAQPRQHVDADPCRREHFVARAAAAARAAM